MLAAGAGAGASQLAAELGAPPNVQMLLDFIIGHKLTQAPPRFPGHNALSVTPTPTSISTQARAIPISPPIQAMACHGNPRSTTSGNITTPGNPATALNPGAVTPGNNIGNQPLNPGNQLANPNNSLTPGQANLANPQSTVTPGQQATTPNSSKTPLQNNIGTVQPNTKIIGIYL
ncbi:MAG: hypothetical protein IPP67_03310 [Rhodospirillaceae bacterium]|nr:hypothetical protein [Rhodospirillaceae bacterium]